MKRVPGVEDAVFIYDEAGGCVRFDPDVTHPSTFIAELERMTGFKSVERPAG